MRKKEALVFAIVFLTGIFSATAFAAFDSGSTGADGAFNPTSNTVLQIPDSGVFNFTTVNIPSGVTVTFTKNSTNTPVTILAQGDVTIAGTISVNGGNASGYSGQGAGGPGGFDGGYGGIVYQNGRRGEGPGSGGGGAPWASGSNCSGGGGGGGYGANGGNGGNCNANGGTGGSSYGNGGILPLIGGSGGGGGGGTNTYAGGSGGGGGGAILIASSGTITISGSITANGGNGAAGENNGYGAGGGGGSGGAIRLIANTIAGSGSLSATGGSGNSGCCGWGPGANGGVGRIRLDAWAVTFSGSKNPVFSSSYYPVVVTPSNTPALSIVSVGGVNAPSNPLGKFQSPDIYLPYNAQNPITIVIAATNVPISSQITISAYPAVGNVTSTTATLSGTDASSTASAQMNLSTSYTSQLIVTTTFQLTASNGGPIYAEGEKVVKVRVTASFGGKSSVTYITESGREIPARHGA